MIWQMVWSTTIDTSSSKIVTMGTAWKACGVRGVNSARNIARTSTFLLIRITLCSVPPGRAQREPQGYAGLTINLQVSIERAG